MYKVQERSRVIAALSYLMGLLLQQGVSVTNRKVVNAFVTIQNKTKTIKCLRRARRQGLFLIVCLNPTFKNVDKVFYDYCLVTEFVLKEMFFTLCKQASRPNRYVCLFYLTTTRYFLHCVGWKDALECSVTNFCWKCCTRAIEIYRENLLFSCYMSVVTHAKCLDLQLSPQPLFYAFARTYERIKCTAQRVLFCCRGTKAAMQYS